jgi:hypothetical protein
MYFSLIWQLRRGYGNTNGQNIMDYHVFRFIDLNKK